MEPKEQTMKNKQTNKQKNRTVRARVSQILTNWSLRGSPFPPVMGVSVVAETVKNLPAMQET